MTIIANDLSEPIRNGAELTGDFDTQIQYMSPRVQKLKNYWETRKERRGRLPCISDIELMDIYGIASHIAIDDVDGDQEDFKNRFWGGELTWRFAFEATGKQVIFYKPSCLAEKLIDHYQEIMRSRQPYWQKAMQVRGRYNTPVPVEALHLPLSGKDQPHVKHVLSIFDFASDASSD